MTHKLLSLFLLALLLVAPQPINSKKPYVLKVLNILQLGAISSQGAKTGRTVSQIVADVINNRSDILPDYHIDFQFEDESGGNMVPQVVLKYVDSFQQQGQRPNDTYQSPIIIGPTISTGCKAIGTFLHHVSSVCNSIQCSSTALQDHKLYPNLYLMITGDVIAYTIARFLKDVGKWGKVGVLTNAGNVNDYSISMQVKQIAGASGVEFPWFNMILDIHAETVISLKESDIRIVLFYYSVDVGIWKFLCLAFLFGLRGPKYLFIVNQSSFSDPLKIFPSNLPTGCTPGMLIEQVSHTFWAGSMYSPRFPNLASDLGYTPTEFEAMLNKALDGTVPGDYVARLAVHDAVMQGLLALDSTEKELRKLHLTLRDYSVFPKQIMTVANQSVFRTNRTGLKIGWLHYDELGLNENLTGSIAYWSPDSGLRDYYACVRNIDVVGGAVSMNYNMFTYRYFDWKAWGGNSPRDSRQTITVINEVSTSVFTAVIILATVVSVLQLIAMGSTWLLRESPNNAPVFPKFKCIGYFGCIWLNAAAIAFSWGTVESPFGCWISRIVLLVAGFSIANASLTLRIICLAALALKTENSRNIPSKLKLSESNSKSLQPSKQSTVKIDSTASTATIQFDEVLLEADSIFNCMKLLAFVAVNLVIVLIWLLGVDPLTCFTEILAKDSTYQEDKDTYIEVLIASCRSANFVVWICVLAGLQILAFGVGMFRVVPLIQNKKTVSHPIPEFFAALIGFGNAATLFCAVLLVLLTIGNQVSQQITFAFAILSFSAITSATWSYPMAKAIFNRTN